MDKILMILLVVLVVGVPGWLTLYLQKRREKKLPEKPCEKCKKMSPRGEVMIWSREYVGKVWICDDCYVDINGNQIRRNQ